MNNKEALKSKRKPSTSGYLGEVCFLVPRWFFPAGSPHGGGGQCSPLGLSDKY